MPSHNKTASTHVGLLRAFRSLIISVVQISGRKFYVAILLMFLSSLAEGLGVAVFLPALQFAGFDLVNQGSTHHLGALVETWLSRFGFGTRLSLATLLALLAFIMLVRTAFIRMQSVYVTETVYQFVTRMELRVYESVVRASWASIMRRRSSEFINLLTTEHERLIVVMHEFLMGVAVFLSTILYIALALLISVKLTILLVGSGALLAVGLIKKTRQVHNTATQASLEMMKVSAEALEHLQNLKTVKAYAAQDRDVSMFWRVISKASGRMIETQKHAAAASFWWEGGSLIMIITVLYFALISKSSSPAATLLLFAIIARITPRLSALQACAQSVVSNLPAHTRIEAAISELGAEAEPFSSPNLQLSLQRSLTVEAVSFRFQPHSPNVLNEISITIPAGKITAIVGSSGAGKSTLADLAMGMLMPDAGRILLDGKELSTTLTHAWRANTGYVSQDTVLFCDSIRSNLQWAKPEATDAEMREALRMTAADFVLELPDGLETVVGERGMRFSQGERQRLALARAMLRKPSLLILDEATNNLDSENEYRVMESVARLRDGLTILIIAHRMSALRFVDDIYVLANGRVVEHGSWDTLFNRAGGRLREFCDVQNTASKDR